MKLIKVLISCKQFYSIFAKRRIVMHLIFWSWIDNRISHRCSYLISINPTEGLRNAVLRVSQSFWGLDTGIGFEAVMNEGRSMEVRNAEFKRKRQERQGNQLVSKWSTTVIKIQWVWNNTRKHAPRNSLTVMECVPDSGTSLVKQWRSSGLSSVRSPGMEWVPCISFKNVHRDIDM